MTRRGVHLSRQGITILSHNGSGCGYIQLPDMEEKPLPVSSSVPPVFPREKEALFRDVLKVMNACKLPYVVSGTFALHEYTGIWRDTKDLDLFVTSASMPGILEALEDAGFLTEIHDPVWIAKCRRGEYFVDLITGMSNSVIHVDESWIHRGVASEVLGIPVRVLAPEELIASKLFVLRRERFDGSDIAHVLFALGRRLNWGRLLELVGEHWEMLLWALVLFRYIYPANTLDVPLEVWDLLLHRFQEDLHSPNPQAHFRGSLIDENMFAIDVKEWGLRNIIEDYRVKHKDKVLDAPKPIA